MGKTITMKVSIIMSLNLSINSCMDKELYLIKFMGASTPLTFGFTINTKILRNFLEE